MSGLVKRIRVWFASVLSVETLLREQKLLLFAMLFYFCASGVSGVFLNLFLYQATVSSTGMIAANALTNVILFNIYTYIFVLVMSCGRGLFSKHISEKNGMLIGLGVYIFMFGMILLTRENINKYLVVLSVLNAAGSSFFHASYNEIIGYSFDERTKRLYISIVSAVMMVAGILTPIVAGMCIQAGNNMNGYIVAFGTALVMLAASAAFTLSVRLPRKKRIKRTYYAGVLVHTFKDKNLLFLHLGELLRGMREGVVAFLFPVLIYTLSENAFYVGFYVAICSVLQMLGERHVSRGANDENRMGLMLFSVAVMVVGTLVFVFGFNVMSIYAYGIITALIGAFLYIPIASLFHWAMGQITNSAKKTNEIQSVRELFINFGKIVGALLTLLMYKANMLLVAVIVVNVLLVLVWVLFSRVGEETEEKTTIEVEMENVNDAD